jgi:hypothetical protein
MIITIYVGSMAVYRSDFEEKKAKRKILTKGNK